MTTAPRFMMVVDIETKPNMHRDATAPRQFFAPKNWKNQEKIDAYIQEKQEEWVGKMPLDLDYAQISCIGISMGDKPAQAFVDGQPKTDGDGLITEAGLLKWFWAEAVKAKTIVGFNVQGFDLPIIQRRSWALGVEPSMAFYELKPWDNRVVDLMKRLYHNGYGPGIKYRGLKAVCAMYGIENSLPDLDGSMAGDMDAETLAAYCASDVEMTRELAVRTQGHYWA